MVVSLVVLGVLVVGLVTLVNMNYFAVDPAMPPATALYLDPAQPIAVRVADLLSYMTVEEKIGQMTLVEKNSISKPGDIAVYHIGALLSGSGAKPEENTPAGWRQ